MLAKGFHDYTNKKLRKKMPGLKPLVIGVRNIIRWLYIRSLLPNLYPQKTDKKLVRFGPSGDGGYLIPDDLEGIGACFSPGVSLISGFEMDCATRGIKVFLADATVDGPTEQNDLFDFSKVFIGGSTKENFISLDDWVMRSTGDENFDLMLQMDIEGYEYEVLNSISDKLLSRFRIIVVEFHKLDRPNKKNIRAFNRILKTHSCLHIHPNNYYGTVQLRDLSVPRIMEFTFLRKDRVVSSGYQNIFPHPLDFDNTPNPSIVLPKCWYHE